MTVEIMADDEQIETVLTEIEDVLMDTPEHDQ